MEWAKGKDTAAGAWARAYDQHCRWRAQIRNPGYYSHRQIGKLTGVEGGPLLTKQAVIHVYIPENQRDDSKTICPDRDWT